MVIQRLTLALVLCASVSSAGTLPSDSSHILKGYARLPLYFEPNLGQADAPVRFLARTSAYAFFLTGRDAGIVLSHGSDHVLVRTSFEDADSSASLVPSDRQSGVSAYYVGNDRSKWLPEVPHYGRVTRAGIYPGIDVVYYGTQQQIEYDFVVAPGADPSEIRFAFQGADSLKLNEAGDVVLTTRLGDVVQHKPRVWQEAQGKRVEVAARYRLEKGWVELDLASYDRKQPLVIDPVVSLVYSTLLGGGSTAGPMGIAVDASGAAYVVGSAASYFPQVNSYQSSGNIFITKLNPYSGSGAVTLAYSTLFGGAALNSNEQATGVAVDGKGAVYVTGSTPSLDFPVLNAYQSSLGGSRAFNAFITKINPYGGSGPVTLSYSTYFGGNLNEGATGIAVDSTGAAYIAGGTHSPDFPLANAYQSAQPGPRSTGFVAKFNAYSGVGKLSLAYSTYLGGTGGDALHGIAVDGSGAAYVAGSTSSTDFPVVNAYQAVLRGPNASFITKLNSYSGSGNVTVGYSTLLGGTQGAEGAYAVAVDGDGAAYITGYTQSANFPLVNAAYSKLWCPNCFDAYVARFNPFNGSGAVTLSYSTYLGGSYGGRGIAVDTAGAAYVTGSTPDSNFPIVNAYQPARSSGNGNAFVTKLNPYAGGTVSLAYSTYLGGSGEYGDSGIAIAVDPSGAVYVAGITASSDFPLVNDSQSQFVPGFDNFVAKLVLPGGTGCASLAASPQPPLTVEGSGGLQTVAVTFTGPCAYTAASNSPWISDVTPVGSGNGNVAFVVAPNPGAARSGSLTIAGVAYAVNQGPGAADTTPAFGAFDTPANGITGVTGPLGVTGWALDNTGVKQVNIYRDPVSGETAGSNGFVFVGTASMTPGARPDVRNAYPLLPNSNSAGWGYQLLTNFLPNSGNGTFKLHVIASDAAGNTMELGAPGRQITVSNASAVNPFGTIDTPAQGATVSGNAYVNYGWALTPQLNQIPIDGSTITVYIDGVAAGHPVYNQPRGDIMTLFPGYKNTAGAVGYYVIDTTQLRNGVHTISWLVTDNAGHGSGLGSRYFTVSN